MREVGIGPGGVAGIGPLQAYVRCAQGVHPFCPVFIAGQSFPSGLDDISLLHRLLRGCSNGNPGQVHLQLRRDIGHQQNPLRLQHGIEHLLAGAGVIAGDPGQRSPVDAGWREPLRCVGTPGAEAFLVSRARLLPEAFENHPVLVVEAGNRQHGDVAMLRVDPCAGR